MLFIAWQSLISSALFALPLLANCWQKPRFMLEMLIGIGAIVLTTFAAFQHTIPGALSWAMKTAAAVVLCWIALNSYGLIDSVIEPSTVGYRHYCMVETFIYTLPPLLITRLLARRRLVLDASRTGFKLGLAAGLIPAWYMQLIIC